MHFFFYSLKLENYWYNDDIENIWSQQINEIEWLGKTKTLEDLEPSEVSFSSLLIGIRQFLHCYMFTPTQQLTWN